MKKQLKHELVNVLKMIRIHEEDWREWVRSSRTGDEKLEREEGLKLIFNAFHLLKCDVRNRIDDLNVPDSEEEN
jgi:hypothetical protein